jgi:ATP-dependent RNA helicase RhlE
VELRFYCPRLITILLTLYPKEEYLNLDQLLNDSSLTSYSGKNDSTTIQSADGFDDLDITPILLKGINRLSFKQPTPIQKASIPPGIHGNDIIAIALTGSGKTIAFGIPMLQRLSKMKRGCGLVMVPTRELAMQVEESLQTVSRMVNIRSTVLIGGASISLQQKALRKNPRIIIATPGRLMDHMERGSIILSNVEIFVLDEADRMLDMGFIPDIKKIMKSIPDKRQTMLFSATMPKEIEAIAEKFMIDPIRIEADRSGATPSEISHEMFFIKNQDKCRLLAVQLKHCSGPVLVFTRTKRMASRLTAKVKKMGFSAAEIHSDRSQGQRRNALEGFKRGRYQILIATDIAARGIDVFGIELVVNYDMPANSEDYVHRIGRTGRAGKTGHAISFATTDQRGSIRSLERFMKTKLMVSALPALPSEALLIQEAGHFNSGYKSSKADNSMKRKFSKDRSSRRKTSKFQNSHPSDFTKGDSNNGNAYWTNLKKNRPAKNKSKGHGSERRNHTRRK